MQRAEKKTSSNRDPQIQPGIGIAPRSNRSAWNRWHPVRETHTVGVDRRHPTSHAKLPTDRAKQQTRAAAWNSHIMRETTSHQHGLKLLPIA
ncbi:hypothetical protein Nepgr_032597 [Nepenthes gracilis]|uniref:Uncharacterized protein n=1 Tax=Nepenthes gracilis TaxID=150966 RepID=A0AAD3TKD7_NEPGR|nr:hypothetical protein Nepgr_032597 [Nepenthes gracilis]